MRRCVVDEPETEVGVHFLLVSGQVIQNGLQDRREQVAVLQDGPRPVRCAFLDEWQHCSVLLPKQF